MNVCVWTNGGLIWLGKAYVLKEKYVQVTLYQSQIPHGLAWVWNQASTVTGQWLTFPPSHCWCGISESMGWDGALCRSKTAFTSPRSQWQWNNITESLHAPCLSSYIGWAKSKYTIYCIPTFGAQDRQIIYNSIILICQPLTDFKRLLPPAAEHKTTKNSSLTQLSLGAGTSCSNV